MEKESQKRSLTDIIREKNPLHSASEFFNSKVKTLMVSLRSADSQIRELVIGAKKQKSLKDVLKDSKSMFNKKEYINSFVIMDDFRQRLGQASSKCEELRADINVNYKEYFVNELASGEKDSLISFRERIEKEREDLKRSKASIYLGFVKEASVLDFFRSVFTQRGRALRAWEKAHGKQIEKMKEELVQLFTAAVETLEKVNDHLKTMSYALSIRNVASYNSEAKKFVETFKKFNKQYIKFYEKHIKDLISEIEHRNTLPMDDSSNTDTSEDASKRSTIPGEPAPEALQPINDSVENDFAKKDSGLISDKKKPSGEKKKKTPEKGSKTSSITAVRARLEKLAKSI